MGFRGYLDIISLPLLEPYPEDVIIFTGIS
jgi:hypothetical protein